MQIYIVSFDHNFVAAFSTKEAAEEAIAFQWGEIPSALTLVELEEVELQDKPSPS